jgi:hypothetical protein
MSFSLDLSKAIENIKENRDKIVRGTLIQISNNIIKRTPVGNPSLWSPQSLPAPKGYVGGSLRGAWQASIGGPDFTKTSRKQTSGIGATGAEASGVANKVVVGQTYYLTNPLPYARRVEFGWSTQAPQGMVRRSVIEAQRILDSQ